MVSKRKPFGVSLIWFVRQAFSFLLLLFFFFLLCFLFVFRSLCCCGVQWLLDFVYLFQLPFSKVIKKKKEKKTQ